jgi:hypothetical protein
MSTIGVTEVSVQERDGDLPETLEIKMPEGSRTLREMVNSSGFSRRGISNERENCWTARNLSVIRWSSKNVYGELIDHGGSVICQKTDTNGKSWIVTINNNGIAIQG